MSNHETAPIGKEYPFKSRFLEINGQHLHYIDQGSGNPILFLHGNPTWSYMWRNIIPYLTNSARCIAVDLIGMGRSDKSDVGYTFLEHVDYISQFIDKLGLSDLTIVGHDWGMAIGLQYAMNHSGNVKAVAMIEPQALYPCPDWSVFTPAEAKELFQTLRDPELGWPLMRDKSVFVEGMPTIIINRTLTPEEHEQYREPFKDQDNRKPMWMFPNQIPIDGSPNEVVQAVLLRNKWFTEASMPKILFYATPGCTIREPQISWCQANLQNFTTFDIGKGYHHLVEENPHAIGQELQRWYGEVSSKS
ncbi:haloalkane dehalogenase [Paenibacillus chondroitinus]|uniref:Haloalkane dehalogenase n=1 Tax=Paenibacillus chondroitinus TaxID=59842 RepID=A0ABU6DK18_9BACL|nr:MULTISPECIES: haloalkane dehalogenase [Paenibacillus]MCY9660688.1 haloalkane dehalogenase [Paenibacillus anseongense]MEB4798132.1 haloalkane dehalogenase [Paenibacillus chondroitinus]